MGKDIRYNEKTRRDAYLKGFDQGCKDSQEGKKSGARNTYNNMPRFIRSAKLLYNLYVEGYQAGQRLHLRKRDCLYGMK